MSQESVEIVRRWLAAFDNDTDEFRQLTHPKIEWMPFEENHSPSHGLDGAMRIRNGWIDAWAEHRADIEEMLDGGDDVFVSALLTGRGKASGVAVEVRLYGHVKVRDGKVSYVFEYEDRAEALEAAGVD
jgi:ketosteroid isomerase-like protein